MTVPSMAAKGRMPARLGPAVAGTAPLTIAVRVWRRSFTIDPTTGDTTYPAKVEFPLDYDRRHTLTAIVSGAVPATAGKVVSPVVGSMVNDRRMKKALLELAVACCSV